MLLARWLESIMYLFVGGDLAVPNVPATPYRPRWPVSGSPSPSVTPQPPPFYTPTHCFSCVYNDLRGGGPGPTRYRHDVLRLEFCDTPECGAWGDDVLNRTGADVCGAFPAGIGCKLTCFYYTAKPDIGVIDALAGELCPGGVSSGHLARPQDGRDG